MVRFTRRTQMAWIVILAVCLVGIGQSFSFGVFQLAMLGMIFFGLTQISVSNVPPDSGLGGFVKYNAVFLAVLIAVVGLSIWLAPILTDLGR
jgi:hypothetical protein